MSTYRILVVEDNQALARTIAAILEDEVCCTVVLASDGIAALHALVNAPCDLILLDIALPRLDGFRLAERLAADPLYRDIPVLFVTGAHPWAVLARRRVAHYLSKPFDFSELVNQVRVLLGLAGE